MPWLLLFIKKQALSALRGYMIKKFLISWLLPFVVDAAIDALRSLAMKSENTVDDSLADTFALERDNIIAEIKESL